MDKPGFKASQLLNELRALGSQVESLPAELRPCTRQDGYEIQSCWETFNAGKPIGWKIAATSLAAQAHLGVDGPLAGRIFREMKLEPGSACPFANNRMKVAELEFAFVMGATLPPRSSPYSIDEVESAVEALHLAIEIPDSRYCESSQVGAAQLIADNACANYFVFGPEVSADWRNMDLGAHPVSGFVNACSPHTGIGANVLGGPHLALHWLANELSRLGLGLNQGMIVSTGTCVSPMTIAAGDYVRGDFGSLGTIEVRIAG